MATATTTTVNYTFGVANGDEIKLGLPVQLTANEVRANMQELDTQGVTWNHIYSAKAFDVDASDSQSSVKLAQLQITGVTGAEIVTTSTADYGDEFPYYPTIE